MPDIYFSPQPVEIDLDEPVIPGEQPVPEPHNQPFKKKKKHRIIRHFIRIIACLLVAVFLFVTVASIAIGYTRKNLKRNDYISKTELHNNPLVTNILLVGIDGTSDDSTRSDSMILLSLDYAHAKIKMTSFLRDSWLTIPDRGSYHKLNSSFAFGGVQLLTDTLEYNFKVDIDHYIKVDFAMFTRIIDKLGGIDIEITETEAKFINRTTRYTVSSGKSVHIDGNVALVYSRIRKLDSDYMRTYRQRKVITAIIDKIRHTGLSKLYRTVRDVLPLLETDLSPVEIALMFYKGGFAAAVFGMQQIRIPTEELMYADYRNGQWVEIIDIEGCREQIYDFIYKSYKDENNEE